MVTSTSSLAMSRPATRSQNSGSSCTSCIVSSYDERAVTAAVVRGSQGHREIWSAGSRHHSAALKIGSRRQTLLRGPARQGGTTSANDRGHSLPGRAPARRNISRQAPADASAAAPGAAGPSGRGGSAAPFLRRSGAAPAGRLFLPPAPGGGGRGGSGRSPPNPAS